MEKRLMAILAHPDDESFGPSGTLINYTHTETRVRLITATKGEAGKNALGTKEPVGQIRERELRKAADIIGLEKIHFLGYRDKTLCDLDEDKPIKKMLQLIKEFKPQVLITFGPTGISLHPDHRAVHKWVTKAFRMIDFPKKLYYYTVPRNLLLERHPDITFDDGEITTIIDVSKYRDIKKKAILSHQTQRFSIERIFDFAGGARPIRKKEYFVLADHKLGDYEPEGCESDLFQGICIEDKVSVAEKD